MNCLIIFAVTLSNQYIKIYVGNESGRFYVETVQGDPDSVTDDYKPLLFKARVPTSIEYLLVDGKPIAIDGRTTAFNVPPQKVGKNVVVGLEVHGISLQRIVSITRGPTTGRMDTMKIEYRIINRAKEIKDVKLCLVLDTLLGKNDGAPFRIPGKGYLVNEMVFEGNRIPSFWYAFDDIKNPTIKAQGTLYGGAAIRPKRVIFSTYPSLKASPSNYTPKGRKIIGKDTAVAMVWHKKLEPGKSWSFATLYGIYGATLSKGTLFGIAISTPAIVSRRFLLIADIENGTAFNAENVTATLSVKGKLRIVSEPQKSWPEIKSGQKIQASWTLEPVELCGKPATIELAVKGTAILKTGPREDVVKATRIIRIAQAPKPKAPSQPEKKEKKKAPKKIAKAKVQKPPPQIQQQKPKKTETPQSEPINLPKTKSHIPVIAGLVIATLVLLAILISLGRKKKK